MKLNNDQKKYLKKEMKDFIHLLSYYKELIDTDKLSDEQNDTLTSLLSFKTTDILQILKPDDKLVKEQEEKFLKIRQANEKIRRLEFELAQNKTNISSISDLSFIIQNIENIIKNKLNKNDLHGIVKLNITNPYSIEVSYIPMFMSHYHNSKNPVSDKEKYEAMFNKLKNQGYTFSESSGDYLLFNDKNIELLSSTIKKEFPQARFLEITNSNFDTFDIKSFIFSISFSELITSEKMV